jgi:hypothetical protein
MSESPRACQSLSVFCECISELTGIEDGHGGATEELTASGTELDLYTDTLVDSPPKSCSDLFSGPALEYTQCVPEYLVVRP